MQYEYENKTIKIGNAEFTNAENEKIVGTVLYLNIDGTVVGSLVLSDEIKANTKETIEKLKATSTSFYGNYFVKIYNHKKYTLEELEKEKGIKKIVFHAIPLFYSSNVSGTSFASFQRRSKS